MIRRIVVTLAVVLLAMLAVEHASAQYYSWGVDPPSLRWNQMKAKNHRVVYPDTAQHIATRMMHYLDAVNKDISYGYRYPQMSIPFVVHPSNFRANGIVMWMPRRVDFLSTPSINGYSMPWLKQLVAHEYRHAVQYNNLNRGVVKWLSYIIGQQSSTIGLLFMPLWMMEGDAVHVETEMSTFGRGLQPSFTMIYRAQGLNVSTTKNIDKWFSGSYSDYIPNHYALGYVMCRHGYNRFGRVMGDDFVELMVRRPYMIVSTSWVLKRLYGRSETQLFYDTFHSLNSHWGKLLPVHDSTEPIAVPRPKSHTIYSHLHPLGEGRYIALKEDMDRPTAFVIIDTAAREKRIAYTGYVSSRPALDASGRVWWTEYRRSALFAEKVASRLCYMDIEKGRARSLRKMNNVLYVTPMNDGNMAWVEYTPDGRYTIVADAGKHGVKVEVPMGSEVHGMAWDNLTGQLYMIITDDRGMHIAVLHGIRLKEVTRPAYITLSDLRAKDGKLYYGSIASGRDQMHLYDIKTKREYQLSTVEYGAFQPMPIDSAEVVGVSYDRRGYMPVTQRVEGAREVMYRPSPPQLLLPESRSWNVVNLDTVHFDKAVCDTIAKRTPPRRFHRFLHAFNVHSWAPASYDPYAIIEESNIAFNLGATVMWQNILSTFEGFLTWGWNRNEGSVYKGTLRYNGLGVNLWLNGTYGGSQNIHTVFIYNPETGNVEYPELPKQGKYFSVSAGATLPILIERGYHTRQLTASLSWNFSNGMVANVDKLTFENGKVTNFATIGYTQGVHLLNAGISFQDYVRQSHRDFLPPWGVVLAANYAQNPATDSFGQLVVLYGKLYTPGIVKHHSFSVAASYQTSFGGFQSDIVKSGLSLRSSRLIPRGYSSYDIVNDNYISASLNYQLPLWYPDGGWSGVIFFKRLRLNLGGDYASFRVEHFDTTDGSIVGLRRHLWSYGCDLTADFTLLRMPSAATISATLSFYMKHSPQYPAAHNKPFVSFGIGLPF